MKKVTDKLGIEYYDASDVITPLPDEHKYLLPADTHLTRYGNQLVADALEKYLRAHHAGHRSGQSYDGTPKLIGDYDTFVQATLSWHPDMGFRAFSNRHGLRMREDLDVPKTRQRILCLGDSLTFGPHVDNQDTYPSILARKRPDLEILNAGISGYTITDQESLFLERARHCAPDVTVLQVTHNDIIELSAFIRNYIGREPVRGVQASEAESRYMEYIRDFLSNQNEGERRGTGPLSRLARVGQDCGSALPAASAFRMICSSSSGVSSYRVRQ